MLAVNPLDLPRWARRIKAMTVTAVPTPTFLMATGELSADTVTRGLAARFCRGSDAVLLRGYPEAIAGPRDDGRNPYRGVYVVGWPDARQWLVDRFGGAAPVGNCDR